LQRLLGLDAGPPLEILPAKLAEPASVLETLLSIRVLDDPIELDVGGDDDLSHFSGLLWY
jgi:hypothetical protein